jgi:hypothetical protein
MKTVYRFIFVLTFISCSNDDDITDANLSGTVLGESFAASGGNAFTVNNTLSIQISNISANCDSEIALHDYFLSFEVPKGTGPFIDIELEFAGNDKSVVEYSDAAIIITAIKSASITGKIVANFNADNKVEGTFEVPLCE